ncbi:mechanosensitive ion channel family protein [Aureimonas sp. AU12]|uniref:mechanosensitive ion channel family protein n=1 Tax=Aureimonas sp. AU12 TaxID=1638161 RepID=UPI00078582DD|nr:mechanosensitive ion channel family protein [Aureimonas sp. AU12]
MVFSTTLLSGIVALNAVGLIGILVWHLISAERAIIRLVVQIAFFVTMSGLLLRHDILPRGTVDGEIGWQSVALVAAKLLWWLHLAWALIGFVRIYLVVEGHPRQARLLQDLVVGGVYLGTAAAMLAFVFAVPIGTLVATSGVVAIILGLALQNTLGDVFSGIALSIGRPYAIGDWILLGDGTEGRVVESNWRSTHLLTSTCNIVVLPNSILAKLALTNISRPAEAHVLVMTLRIAPTRMPSVIVEVLRSALVSCNTILRDPPPAVAVRKLDATALEVELQFTVHSPSHRTPARNEVVDRVYRHCKSAGLLLALPPTAGILTADLPTEETAATPPVTALGLIDAVPIFSRLEPEEKRRLADAASTRTYAAGDVVAEEGAILDCLMIVRAGTIQILQGGKTVRFLSAGDAFGELGLLAGSVMLCRMEALSPVTVYVIPERIIAELLAERPGLAEDLARELADRLPSHAFEGPSEDRRRKIPTLIRTIKALVRKDAARVSPPA